MKKRIVALMSAVLLLCGMLPFGVRAAGQTLIPQEAGENMTVYGRTAYNTAGALRLFWTNSGFSVKFDGTSLTAEISVTSTGANSMAYLNVYVDGVLTPTQTLKLNSSNATYTLAEDLPQGVHTVEVRKRNEAAYGSSASVTVKNLTTEGTFMTAPTAPARKIEFVGDSITSGFGNLVTNGSGSYTSATVEGTMTWATLAAKMLGAEAQVVSRSGIGYCRRATIHGTTDNSFYNYYTKTAALPGSSVSTVGWDFENNPSDVVVINLGSNDSGGTYNGATVTDAFMTSEAVAFLELVREKNPDATIIWHYGLMGSGRRAALEEAVEQRREDGDDKVYFLLQRQFNSATEGLGTDGHPAVQAHINRSEDLARFIAEIMGWEWNAAPMLAAQRWWSEQYNTPEQLALMTPGSAQEFSNALQAADRLLATAGADSEEMTAASRALWLAYAERRLLSDMASDYIVVDTCDDTHGVQLGGNGTKGFDYTDRKEGEACLRTGGTGNVYINHVNSYNVPLPADASDWFLECWLYIDHPERMPAQSVLEISQVVDQSEISWSLNSLGLQAGWNKLQLPMKARPAAMTNLKNIRLFLMSVTEPVVLKLDYIVLAKGRVAANLEEWNTAVAAAKEFLATTANAEVSAALAVAEQAVSQADVDAGTARLQAAVEDAKNHVHRYENDCDDTCNGCGEEREAPHKWEDEWDDFCEGCGEEREITLLGDVNGDKRVDSTDARVTLQYAVQKINATALDLTVADVNGDSRTDSTDARLILQYAVQKN